jgi:hypothetical protein
MRQGIFRPRQGVQRVTANAGNRAFIAGGRGAGRRLPAGTAPTLRQKAIALALLLAQIPTADEEEARDDV